MMKRQIFPIPIYQGRVKNNDRLKDILIGPITETKDNIIQAPGDWLTTKCITSFEYDEINENVFQHPEISEQYMGVLETFFDEPWEIDIPNIWYNYYENGEYQEAHMHMGEYNCPLHLACVHFLSFDPSIHSPLVFTDPLSAIKSSSFESGYSEKCNLKVEEGDFLMFPNYLLHEVKAGLATPEYPRITVSFNIRMLKYG